MLHDYGVSGGVRACGESPRRYSHGCRKRGCERVAAAADIHGTAPPSSRVFLEMNSEVSYDHIRIVFAYFNHGAGHVGQAAGLPHVSTATPSPAPNRQPSNRERALPFAPQWLRMSLSSHPASWSASARIGIVPEVTAFVHLTNQLYRSVSSPRRKNAIGRNGLPKMSRSITQIRRADAGPRRCQDDIAFRDDAEHPVRIVEHDERADLFMRHQFWRGRRQFAMGSAMLITRRPLWRRMSSISIGHSPVIE